MNAYDGIALSVEQLVRFPSGFRRQLVCFNRVVGCVAGSAVKRSRDHDGS